MKIPNPWNASVLYRCVCKTSNGDVVCVGSTNEPTLDVPEANEVLIEPVKQAGRGVVVPIGQGRIWSKKWGLLEIEDHAKKMKIEEEEAKLAKRKMEQVRREKQVTNAKPTVPNACLKLGDKVENKRN